MITTLIQVVDALTNLWKHKDEIKISAKDALINVVDTTSLTDIAKLSRVEPLAVISKDCLTLDYLPDIMHSMLNIFIGYYLQAIAIGARVDSVKVIKTLDRLNPDRDATGWLIASSLESMQDVATLDMSQYEYRLPRQFAMEAKGGKGGKNNNDDKGDLIEETSSTFNYKTIGPEVNKNPGNASVRDPAKILSETANLAVGKIINVEIGTTRAQIEGSNTNKDQTWKKKNGDTNPKNSKQFETKNTEVESTTSIPVMVRLSPSLLPTASIVKIMTSLSQDDTIVERFHAWRSGRISFIKDLILCQDMIEEHRKALINDEQGTYSEIMRRVNNSRKFGLLTQNPSLATASNLFVITHEVALQIEQKLGGKLSNARIRERAFDSTYAMIIAVIDTRYNRVIFYHRGVATATDVSISEIKASSKGKGPDIMDIFKAYQLGNAPSY